MKRVAGILGGMGPAATVDLFDRIVRATPARTDQEHLHILIDNNTAIPDRTEAILHQGPDPLPALQAGIRGLESQGAEVIAIPCNTAHHYLPALQQVCDCPILNMITETAQAIRQRYGHVSHAGIMATRGTLAVRLYQDALEAVALQPVLPQAAEIDSLMQAIYGSDGIKAGAPAHLPRARLLDVGTAMIQRGAEVIILGCTELPLVLAAGDLPVPLIASNQVLAEAVVREAMPAAVPA